MFQSIKQLCSGILEAARAGQILPILTIGFTLQLVLQVVLAQFEFPTILKSNDVREHTAFLSSTSSPSIILPSIRHWNKVFILLNLVLFLIPGYILLFSLYRHSIQHIFNRKIPKTIQECIPSFILHLHLLRPIEIMFRYMTLRFRVLPDIIVLGEVRCGTTSFCQQLASVLKEVEQSIDDDYDYHHKESEKKNKNDQHEYEYFFDCHTPFCPWMHPELDHKETFYFVGHYLGLVTPQYYRMCFPLQITKLWNEMYYMFKYYLSFITAKSNDDRRRMKKPLFITFDGCAQYLTSPTAPYLIAAAYKLANQKPPVLISCVRDPVKQTLSWWKYENNAQTWGEGIGLKEWNNELRSSSYPPKSISEALKFTQSNFVNDLYERAEALFPLDSLLSPDGNRKKRLYLPAWGMSWPGGQLTGIGRNAKFSDNILRYEGVFSQAFDGDDLKLMKKTDKRMYDYGSIQRGDSLHTKQSLLQYMNILPIEYLSQEDNMKEFMVKILKQVALRKDSIYEMQEYESGLRYFECQSKQLCNVHRNASTGNSSPGESDKEATRLLEEFFSINTKNQ